MARLTWLASVLRDAGLTVYEVDGWKTRGASSLGSIRGITCHATAGSRTATDAAEINVLINGSKTAPPPIAQLYLSRTGAWHVVASGQCNHNKIGWAGPNKGYGNNRLLGIEAANDNRNEKWPDVQYRSYVHGVAALVKRLGIPVARVAGHKEHQPAAGRPPGETSTKTDPTFDMGRFRADVAAVLSGGEWDEMATEAEVEQALIRALNKVQPYGHGGPRGRLKDTKRYPPKGWADMSLMGQLAYVFEYAVDPQLRTTLAQVLANQQQMLGTDWVNEEKVVDGVLAGLGTKDLDDVVAALRAAFGDRVTELAAKLTAPTT